MHASVRDVLESWARATREGRQDDVLANHAAHAMIYDVLPPLRYASAATYRQSWEDWQPDTQGEGTFELDELSITTGEDVAFAYGLLQCGGTLPNGSTFHDTVRVTFCLVRVDGRWMVTHQHISKPLGTS